MPDEAREIDPQKLRAEISVMVEALAHPAYVDAMRQVRAAPRDMKLQEGSRLLNPDALRAAGVPLPAGMRISSRYFEDGLPTSIEFGDAAVGEVNAINALNAANPGLLDKLNVRNPGLVEGLVRAGKEQFVATAGCCCGGAASACGGCGG